MPNENQETEFSMFDKSYDFSQKIRN